MNVTNVEPVKRDAVGVAARGFWIPCLSILLGFGKLCDDRYTKQFLSSQLDGERDGFFLSELDIADTVLD